MSACATETSNSSCGVLFSYPQQFQKAAAEQYELLQSWPEVCAKKEAPDNCPELLKVKGDFTQLLTLVDDYSVTRDTIRACKQKP